MTRLETIAVNAIAEGSNTFNKIHKALEGRFKGLAKTATRMSLMELEKAGHIVKAGNSYLIK